MERNLRKTVGNILHHLNPSGAAWLNVLDSSITNPHRDIIVHQCVMPYQGVVTFFVMRPKSTNNLLEGHASLNDPPFRQDLSLRHPLGTAPRENQRETCNSQK